MNCDLCGKDNPEINIQQVLGKKKKDIHLCKKCAVERGIIKNDETLEFSLSKLVNFYLEKENTPDNSICESCGTSLKDVKKSKKIGCEDCAIQFRRYIINSLGIVQNNQRNSIYKGKMPKRMHIVKDVFIDMELLKKELAEAVKHEDYEKAANLRDKIKQIGSRSK